MLKRLRGSHTIPVSFKNGADRAMRTSLIVILILLLIGVLPFGHTAAMKLARPAQSGSTVETNRLDTQASHA